MKQVEVGVERRSASPAGWRGGLPFFSLVSCPTMKLIGREIGQGLSFFPLSEVTCFVVLYITCCGVWSPLCLPR